MIISTERLSNAYLELNSCGRQFLTDRDYKMIRENGRVDYHILYIEKGTCTIELDGIEKAVPAGNIILFKQYELQEVNIHSRKNIDMVCKHMHAHYDQNYNIDFYADMCHLSVSRFAHIFKEHTGTTPKAYMLGIKISVAKQLLRSTDLSITDIAAVVGIDDVNYFSRMVRKHTGHSPKYFRS